jgi:hypothetical protein
MFGMQAGAAKSVPYAFMTCAQTKELLFEAATLDPVVLAELPDPATHGCSMIS